MKFNFVMKPIQDNISFTLECDTYIKLFDDLLYIGYEEEIISDIHINMGYSIFKGHMDYLYEF